MRRVREKKKRERREMDKQTARETDRQIIFNLSTTTISEIMFEA